jgi:hypothetical protein
MHAENVRNKHRFFAGHFMYCSAGVEKRNWLQVYCDIEAQQVLQLLSTAIAGRHHQQAIDNCKHCAVASVLAMPKAIYIKLLHQIPSSPNRSSRHSRKPYQQTESTIASCMG